MSISRSVKAFLPLTYPPRPTAPISVSCHAPMSPIRKGNEARYRCKYIRPLAATLTHHPETEARMQRGREEGTEREDEVEGHSV